MRAETGMEGERKLWGLGLKKSRLKQKQRLGNRGEEKSPKQVGKWKGGQRPEKEGSRGGQRGKDAPHHPSPGPLSSLQTPRRLGPGCRPRSFHLEAAASIPCLPPPEITKTPQGCEPASLQPAVTF